MWQPQAIQSFALGSRVHNYTGTLTTGHRPHAQPRWPPDITVPSARLIEQQNVLEDVAVFFGRCGRVRLWLLRSCEVRTRCRHCTLPRHSHRPHSWRSRHSFRAQQSRTAPGFTWWWCEPMTLELVMGMTAGDARSVQLGRVSEIQVMLRCLCLVVAECDRTGHQCRRSPP